MTSYRRFHGITSLTPVLVLAMLAAVIVTPDAFARGQREQSAQPQDTEFYGDIRVVGGEEMAPGVPLLITGRLAVVGHGEFSNLVVRTRETLHDESLVFEITGPHLEELYRHQNQIAYLEGWIVRVPKGPRAGAMHVTSFRFLEDT